MNLNQMCTLELESDTLFFLIIANKYCEVHKPVLTESVLFSNRTNINAKAGFIHKHTL